MCTVCRTACYPFMLRHCQYAIHLWYEVSMLSIYVTTLSMLPIYVTALSICYPFMLRHCQYANHLCYDTVNMLVVSEGLMDSKKIWGEITMNKSGGVLIFAGRVWVKQSRTFRVVQLYKLLHFHCTEHVVLSCRYQTHRLNLRAKKRNVCCIIHEICLA